jgi:quinol monooxygenase YgiN
MPVIDGVRTEKTFINNFLHQNPDDPTRFMVYENWVDKDEFLAVQMKRDYRSAYEARLPDLLAEPRRVEVWQPLRTDFSGNRVGAPVYIMPFAFSADQLWQAIRSFRGYEWGEGVGPSVIEGEGADNVIGSVRSFTYYGAPLRQRLTAHSDKARTYSWESCAPYQSIDRYELTLKVEPIGDRASLVTWTAHYQAPDGDRFRWDAFFADEFRKSLVRLRGLLEGRRAHAVNAQADV